MKKICLILCILLVASVLVSCSEEKSDPVDNSSELTDEQKNEVGNTENSAEGKEAGTEEVAEKGEVEKEVPINIVNSSGEKVILWTGDSEEIVKDNEVAEGGLKKETIKVKVVDGKLKTSIKVTSAQNDKVLATETFDVEGDYMDEKPIMFYWNGKDKKLTTQPY